MLTFIIRKFLQPATVGTWGYGENILKELLVAVKDTGLLASADAVYVGLLGAEADRLSAKAVIDNFSNKV